MSLQTHEVGKPLERVGIMDNKDEDLTWIQEQDEDNDIDTISIDNILRVISVCHMQGNQETN